MTDSIAYMAANSERKAFLAEHITPALGRPEEALAALEEFLAGARGQDVPPAVGEKLRKKLPDCKSV